MRKGTVFIASAFFVFFASLAAAAGTVYHVATGGSDEAPGTREAPFAGVQRALEAAGPGDTVLVGPGTFFGQARFVNSGTEGAPIILRGTLGAAGERLTRLEAGEAVDPGTWEPAPDVGPNAWQNRSFGYEPQLLMVGGKFLGHVHRSRGLAMEILAWPEGKMEGSSETIPFWETIGGIYAYHPDSAEKITYLRLAGGADPRKLEITISRGGAVISAENIAHLEIRDLEIAAGDRGITLSGKGTRSVLLENCLVTHGRRRISILNQASDVVVRNCEITMGFYGHDTGAWGGAKSPDQGRKSYVYYFFKFLHGRADTSDDYSIEVFGVSDILIEDNRIETGLLGVNLNTVSDVVVRRNTITRQSSIGITVSQETDGVIVYDNFFHDCNINVRVHRLGMGRGFRRAYIYGNRFSQPSGVGTHIFCHGVSEEPALEEKVYIYHNSFHGGAAAFSWPGSKTISDGVPAFQLINNVFSSLLYSRWDRHHDNERAVEIFDYNWLGGGTDGSSKKAWLGENNIIAAGEFIWDEGETDFRLPAGHAARGSGIDLSRPFTIGDRIYELLPGMEPGYFTGERPDMGAIQH